MSEVSPVDPAPATGGGDEKVQADRQRLLDAQASGKTLSTYIKLSGPGWLQAAITLGGGSLAGALFLGVLGGTSMLWLQTNKPRSGTMNLGGSLTRQVEQDCPVSEASPHIANIGEITRL